MGNKARGQRCKQPVLLIVAVSCNAPDRKSAGNDNAERPENPFPTFQVVIIVSLAVRIVLPQPGQELVGLRLCGVPSKHLRDVGLLLLRRVGGSKGPAPGPSKSLCQPLAHVPNLGLPGQEHQDAARWELTVNLAGLQMMRCDGVVVMTWGPPQSRHHRHSFPGLPPGPVAMQP